MTGRRGLGLLPVLIGAFVVVASLPIAFLAAQQYQGVTGTQVAEDLERDRELARAIAASLKRYLAQRVHLVNTLAADLSARGLPQPEVLAAELETVRRLHPAFRAVAFIDPAGVSRAIAPAVDGQGRVAAGKRYDDREWFKKAVRLPNETSYDIVPSGRALEGPSIVLAAPVQSAAGEVIGVLAGALDLDELRRSIHLADGQEHDRVVVVDSLGRVIVHHSPDWEVDARDLSSEGAFRAAQRQEEGSTEYDSRYTGGRRWGSFVRITPTGWVVSIGRGPEHLAPKLTAFFRELTVSIVVALLFAAAAAVVVAGLLTRPLRRLVDATHVLAAGRLTTSDLPRGSRIREFAQLLLGFGRMADALRTQYADLEQKVAERSHTAETRAVEAQRTALLLRSREEIQRGYAELAALLNTLDRSQILNEGIKKMAASLRSPLAVVYLTDNGPDTLRVKTYTAADPAGLDVAALSPQGLPAEVVRRGELVLLAPGGIEQTIRLQTGLGFLEVAAVIGVPLANRGRVFGALVVAMGQKPDEQAHAFLESAARQLSVALDNAGLYESVRYQSQQLEELNGELRRASDVKSHFLASMSHELRTPLNSIIGFTELLIGSARDPLSDRQRTALEKVHASGKHLLGVINDILDLSKIDAGRMDMEPTRFPLGPLVWECLDAVELQGQAKGITLRATGLEDAPEVEQDRGRVKQILLNLLSNAVKFTREGMVEARVTHDAALGSVTVSVADTGPGIRPEDQAMVFEPFRQAGPGSEKQKGTGLGLTVSRRLAQLLGGDLTLTSTFGEGSVFSLRMPLLHPSVVADNPPQTAEGAPRVLVIDDDRDVLDLVRGAVAEEGIAVEWAPNGREGLTRAHAHRPDVILLDLIMQGADGWDVLRALRNDAATRDVPVVIHSAIENRQRAEHLGANAVLVKPASPSVIHAMLRRFLAEAPALAGREAS